LVASRKTTGLTITSIDDRFQTKSFEDARQCLILTERTGVIKTANRYMRHGQRGGTTAA
jgi:hypothetical protein